MRAFRISMVAFLLTLALGFSLGSAGGVLEASSCCDCLANEGCLDDDPEGACSDEAAEQITGSATPIQVNSAPCVTICETCDNFLLSSSTAD